MTQRNTIEYGGDGTKVICFRNTINRPFSGNCSVPLEPTGESMHPRQGCSVSASECLVLHPIPFHLLMILADQTSAVR